MRAAWAVALVMLTCLPAQGQQFKLSPDERQSCFAGGGEVKVGGAMRVEHCVTPTPDAGKSCGKASDCSVRCEAATRTCAADDNAFGCFDYLNEQGVVLGVCGD